MKEKTASPQETLTEIRQLMERSSRFISLSGLSGVFAGIYALIGAYAVYQHVEEARHGYDAPTISHVTFYFLDAAIVLFMTITTGIYLTTRKARRDGNSILDATARKLLINLAIPLFAGGVFCIALVAGNTILYVAPAMLVFYGLALINASKYTLSDVRALGIAEVGLGLFAAFVTGYGLLFWAIGFGVLHIVYGTWMYFKYEK